jgi:hypothetical protein
MTLGQPVPVLGGPRERNRRGGTMDLPGLDASLVMLAYDPIQGGPIGPRRSCQGRSVNSRLHSAPWLEGRFQERRRNT